MASRKRLDYTVVLSHLDRDLEPEFTFSTPRNWRSASAPWSGRRRVWSDPARPDHRKGNFQVYRARVADLARQTRCRNFIANLAEVFSRYPDPVWRRL